MAPVASCTVTPAAGPGNPCGPCMPGSPFGPGGPCKPSATGSSVLSLGLQTSRTFTVADRVRHSTAALAAADVATHATTAIHLHPIHSLLAAPRRPSRLPGRVGVLYHGRLGWRTSGAVGGGARDEHGT